MSFLPGGGIFNSFTRWLLPSKLDKQKVDWQEDVTQATNQQGKDIKGLKGETEVLRLEHSDLVERIDDTKEHVQALARKVDIGIVETDPLDGELEICRELVLEEKYQTALDLLSKRFSDPKRSNQISPTLKARVLSLQGLCLKHLGQFDEAAQHFLTALSIDPNNPKIQANAVVGYLIKEDTDAAVTLLDRLIADEPKSEMHWANMVYAKSRSGEVLDLEEVPEVVRQSKDVCVAIIDAKRQNDDSSWVSEALDFAQLHPTSKRAQRHGAEAALDIAVQSIVQDTDDPADKTRAMARVKKAAAELSKQWHEHMEMEAAKAAPDVTLLQNTLVAYRITGDKEAANALVQSHADLLLSDDRAKQALGAFAIDTGDDALLDRVLASDFSGSAILRLEKALRDSDWKQALELCETNPEEIALAGRIAPAFARDVLHAMLEDEDARQAAFETIFQRQEQPIPQNDLFLCQMAAKAGLSDLSVTIFERTVAADIGTDAELRRALASEAMERDLSDMVINLLQDHVDPAHDDRARRWLAISYARSAIPQETGVAFFASVRATRDTDAEINRAGGHFHLNRRRPGEAAPWFRRSLAAEPNNVRTQLVYWQTLSRDGASRRAEDFLAAVNLTALEGPGGDRMSMAQLLWRNGREDALEYAYDLVLRHRNDLQVCLGYSGLMLADAFDEDALQLPHFEAVATGAMVRLSRPSQADWTIVIVDGDSDIPSHVSVDNAIVQQAIGKRQGEQFETTSGPSTFIWTVAEIKSKYLHLFHELTRTLQDQFPDNGSFYSVTIVDDDITPILESLRQRRSSIERLEESYRDNPMPLGAMAGAGGGNVIDFAIHLAQSGQKIFSATGHVEDTGREIKIATTAKDQVVVLDAYTAWLLETLNVLEATKDVFPKLTIPASSVDDFSEIIENLGNSPDGRKSMSAQDDGFTIQEATADEVKGQVTEIDRQRQKITSICDVVGIEVPSGMSADLLSLADFMGSQFDCLSVARREEGVVLSADLRLRQIATALSGQEAFGIDALLRVLAAEEAISIEAYADVLLNLCGHGHAYVALNGQILMRMLMADETANLQRFERAAAYLGTPDADIESHLSTAAEFMRRAFRFYGANVKAQRATSIILRNLIRMKGVSLAKMLNFVVQEARDVRIGQFVSQWLRGHFLLETYEREVEASRAE